MLHAQGGACALCRQLETQTTRGTVRRLSVDHDHATGRVRGLLCSRCNLTLGRHDDDLAWFTRAAEYLR